MAQHYKIYPVPTINIPDLHPGIVLQNYELYLGDGEILDIRTRCHEGEEPEIVLAQVIDLNGEVIRRIPVEQVIFTDIEPD